MVSFENFVKLVSPSLWILKVTPSFCFAFKIPDDVTASNVYVTVKNNFTQVSAIYIVIYGSGIFLQTRLK